MKNLKKKTKAELIGYIGELREHFDALGKEKIKLINDRGDREWRTDSLSNKVDELNTIIENMSKENKEFRSVIDKLSGNIYELEKGIINSMLNFGRLGCEGKS